MLQITACNSRYRPICSCELVPDMIGLLVEIVHRSDHEVIGDVVEMSAVSQPWSGHGDMVSRTFACHFDEHHHTGQFFTIPWFEWFQQLQALGTGFYYHLKTSSIFCRCH